LPDNTYAIDSAGSYDLGRRRVRRMGYGAMQTNTEISASSSRRPPENRRHSACDGMSPIDYERYMAEARGAKAA